MKRILTALSACLILLSCSQSPEKKDIALVNDFYEHVLSIKPMTDKYLEKTLSEEVLNSLWEADFLLEIPDRPAGRPFQRVFRGIDRAAG